MAVSAIRGRRFALLVLGVALGACSANSSSNNAMNVDENITTTDINATDEAAAPPRVPNYQDRDGRIYEYVSAVSEEDAKKGKAVGDVSLFAFRGVFDGRYRISYVDNDGRTEGYYECSNPCGVMKEFRQGQLVNRVPYNPRSVIGAAFEDAFNGFLEVSREPKTFQPATYPATPYYPSQATPPATAELQGSGDDNNGL